MHVSIRNQATEAQSVFHFPFSIFHLSLVKPRFFNGEWKITNDKWKMLCLFVPLWLLIIGLCAITAEAQKKDAQKKDDSQDSRPTLEPRNPYREVTREALLNDMQIISLRRSGDTSIKIDLVIKGGAKFDLAGKTGLAKLTQETLLAVNPNLKAELESLQAKIDWGVDEDSTWFHIETPATNMDTVLEIVGRLLVVENIRPEAFNSAQEAHINRIKSNRLSHVGLADKAFMSALFGDHPYGHNIDGSVESVTSIKRGDVYDFMRRFYISNNTFAVVIGNITTDRAIRPFKLFFGGWTKGQIIPPTFRPPKQIAQLKLVKIEAPEASKVEIRCGVLGVKHTDPDYLTTAVLARILSARIQKEGGEATVNSLPRVLPGPFFLSASVPAEQAPAFSRRATEIFSGLTTSPVSGEELAAAKTALANEYSARTPEYYLREIEVYSLPRNYPLEVTKKIESISATDIERVSKKLLEANALTVVVVGKVNEGFKTNP
jgi:zinc protease